jgi:hypothetical protein
MPARTLLPIVVPVLLALGCSGSEPSATTAAPASTAPPATANRTVEMTTDDGQASLSLTGELPPNWPASFPLPPGATPAGSGSLVKDQSGAMVGVFRITGSAEDTFAFYRSNPDVPVTDPSTIGLGPAFVGRAKLGSPWAGSVTVGGAGGADLLVVVLRPSPATSGTTPGTAGTTSTSAPG